MHHRSQGGFDLVRRLTASVSLQALVVPAVAWANDDTTDQAVPPVEVKAGAAAVPIGEPADAEGHADYVVTRSRTGSKTELAPRIRTVA